MRTLIKYLVDSNSAIESVVVKGWIRTRRDSKGFSFLEVNDGSCLTNLQVMAEVNALGYNDITRFTTGTSVEISGSLVESPAKGQKWELHAKEIKLIGASDSTYPLQTKGHSLEFLRTIAHLRPRSNLFGSVFRTRSKIAFAVHKFFQDRDFIYVHTPIITASDCEGAGEMFRVTTLKKNIDENPQADFFGKPTYLTVSGQLEGETFACAFSNIYTFGPTFRAENSNTARHAAEFWMIEPEIAFCDITDDMNLAEEFIKEMARYMIQNNGDDLQIFEKFVDKQLMDRLKFVIERPFVRIQYAEALCILKNSGKKFEFPVEYGTNLQAEHERYLTEEHFKSPVTIYNYPREIKPFYMRLNEDGKTVAAMDLLVPGIGEVIGGSQREERLDYLLENMKYHNLPTENYWWYIDLRKYGTVPHAGFGVGFERLLMFLTGVSNIRDVIPYPRTPGNADF